MASVIVDNHQVLVDEPVEEVDVGHLDVVELVDVELVLQVVQYANQRNPVNPVFHE